MKRLVLFLIVLFISGSAYAGSNPPANVFTLNASTFTAITVADVVAVGRDIAVATSDSSAWVFSDTLAGTVEIPIPAPGTLSMQCRKMSQAGVLFYAKASTGTPTLSLLVGVCRNN